MDMGWLDFVPQNENFIIYDIECTLTPINEQLSANQQLSQRHELLSIAAHSYINNEDRTQYWVIRESTQEARKEIVTDFIKWCYDELQRMHIDEQISITCEQLRIEMGTKKWNDPERYKLSSQFYELQNTISLNILGYNSSAYDMTIILPFMVEAITANNVSSQSRNLIIFNKNQILDLSIKINQGAET